MYLYVLNMALCNQKQTKDRINPSLYYLVIKALNADIEHTWIGSGFVVKNETVLKFNTPGVIRTVTGSPAFSPTSAVTLTP